VKERAKKKLSEMEQFIAYSDEFLERDKLDELHRGIEISDKDLFGNTLNLLRYQRTVFKRIIAPRGKVGAYCTRT
jgi:hypothetical protein